MVSEQPQSRRDTDRMVETTPRSGGASRQGTGGGGGPKSGTKGVSQPQTDMAAKAQETAQDVVQQTQDKAGQVVDQAKEQATNQLASQKDRAADSLGSVAGALRQTGHHLRQNDQHGIAQYADRAAERVEQFTDQLRGKDVQTIVRDVERYARQQPALFLGGAFVLGLLGARFLKSTAQRENDGESGDLDDRAYGGGYRYDRYRPGYYSGSYRGQYDRDEYSGQYGGQYTGGATTGRSSEYGPGTGERSWSVRGTETR